MAPSGSHHVYSHGTAVSAALTPCAPQSPYDDRFEGCYAWCANASLAACGLCKCRGCCADELIATLATQAEWFPAGQAMVRNIHRLCVWLRGGIRLWASGVYDSNSYAQANPIYRQIGRPEGKAEATAQLGKRTNISAAAHIPYLGDARMLEQRCAAPAAIRCAR